MGFGNFAILCDRANVPLCPLVGPYTQDSSEAFRTGIIASCYPRSIYLANTVVFNVGNVFIQLGVLLILALIIFNSYVKYTAVGRREFLDLMCLFTLLTVWSMVTDTGVSPSMSSSYPYIVAIQAGLSSAFCVGLTYFGLLSYQLWEDGSRTSLWSQRAIVFVWGAANFVVAILTFKSVGSLSPKNTVALMACLYVANLALLFIYACEAFYFTIWIFKDWWAAGAQALALAFFVIGQLLMYVFSRVICNSVKHYVNGTFFATLCNGFAILLVYKAWDITTTEDLEFSVSSQENTWDLKSADDFMDGDSEYALSNYRQPSVMY